MSGKVLVVVQRYGEEVTGGSESHARMLVERLAPRYPVEVATTNALDYWTWAPHYAAGTAVVSGVPVHRFAVERGRSADYKAIERTVMLEPHTLADEWTWIEQQGPHCPGLLDHLHRHGTTYSSIIFYTYIYGPTVLGLPLVPERAVLIPTAHDETALRLAPYRALFHLPRAIGFLTPEERALVRRTFRNDEVPDEVLGTVLETPGVGDGAAFRARYGIDGRLFVYLGQVSEGKGVDDLVSWWAGASPDATLVLAGAVRMPIPEHDRIRALGRVSEREKWGALAAADALILPSRFESLGIVLLEAWQAGVPVIVRADNPVTAGQVARSGGGWTYTSADELGAAVRGADRARGARGQAWVAREYAPERFDAALDRLIAWAEA
ncbi:MAG TPA: glycosyltransferase family 4 protein [Candidatus Limnocylindria bacterium]|nr:glycosyltransferase family 4 protein [Candidatus Limnocylindria bacterium]